MIKSIYNKAIDSLHDIFSSITSRIDLTIRRIEASFRGEKAELTLSDTLASIKEVKPDIACFLRKTIREGQKIELFCINKDEGSKEKASEFLNKLKELSFEEMVDGWKPEKDRVAINSLKEDISNLAFLYFALEARIEDREPLYDMSNVEDFCELKNIPVEYRIR